MYLGLVTELKRLGVSAGLAPLLALPVTATLGVMARIFLNWYQQTAFYKGTLPPSPPEAKLPR